MYQLTNLLYGTQMFRGTYEECVDYQHREYGNSIAALLTKVEKVDDLPTPERAE